MLWEKSSIRWPEFDGPVCASDIPDGECTMGALLLIEMDSETPRQCSKASHSVQMILPPHGV